MNLRHHNSSWLSRMTALLLALAPAVLQASTEDIPSATGALPVAETSARDAPSGVIATVEKARLLPATVDPASLDAPPARAVPAPDQVEAEPHPLDHATLEELIQGYQEWIDQHQALNGTYDPLLAESLSAMGELLQRLGDHEAAIEAFQRARHIRRVNDGIYSVSQEPMLRGMIESHLALGDVDAVSDHFDQLLWLYGRGYGADDPRLLPLVNEISDWHLQAYTRNPNRKAMRHLVRAHELVANTINRLSHPVPGGNLMVLPLLNNLVITNYYLADHLRRYPVGSGDGFSMRASVGGMPEALTQEEQLAVNSYQNGRRAQESIVAALMEDPAASTLDRVEALAALGDWYLLFGRTNSAQQAYRQAWEMAAADPEVSPRLTELFGSPQLLALQSTGVKVVAPPEAKDDELVQVHSRLTIGTRGDVRNTEIVAIEPDDNTDLTNAATRELRKLRFRPRLIDGTMSRSEGVEYTLALRP